MAETFLYTDAHPDAVDAHPDAHPDAVDAHPDALRTFSFLPQ